MVICPGTKVPSFTCRAAFKGSELKLGLDTYIRKSTETARHLKHQKLVKKSFSNLGGGYLLIIFYPANFSLVAQKELLEFSEQVDSFHQLNCSLLGCSNESIYSHMTWLTTERVNGGVCGLEFPLLADKTGNLARLFGVDHRDSVLPALVLVSASGEVCYTGVYPPYIPRTTEEILRILIQVQQVQDKGEEGVIERSVQYSNKSSKGSSLRTDIIMKYFDSEEVRTAVSPWEFTHLQEARDSCTQVDIKFQDESSQTEEIPVSENSSQPSEQDEKNSEYNQPEANPSSNVNSHILFDNADVSYGGRSNESVGLESDQHVHGDLIAADILHSIPSLQMQTSVEDRFEDALSSPEIYFEKDEEVCKTEICKLLVDEILDSITTEIVCGPTQANLLEPPATSQNTLALETKTKEPPNSKNNPPERRPRLHSLNQLKVESPGLNSDSTHQAKTPSRNTLPRTAPEKKHGGEKKSSCNQQ